MSVNTAQIMLAGEEATARFGNMLAQILKPGHLVLLTGDLGAGKTSLARAIVRQLMQDPDMDVPSPSFALLQPYEGYGHSVVHADLYRLAAAGDIVELGLFDDPEAIILVEWPERAADLLDRADLRLELLVTDRGASRLATLTSPSDAFDCQQLADRFGATQ